MDNIILGLLLLCSRTIYQLRDRIDKGLNLMYSSSMGSIQAAVKKLLNSGYISFEEVVENGKYKKVYSITESGKQHFFEWVNSPFEPTCAKNPELAKVYFMGFAEKENRKTCVEKHIEYLKEQYATLCAICEDAKNTVVPLDMMDVFNYQLMSACYGRDILKFNIDWYEKMLSQIEGAQL